MLYVINLVFVPSQCSLFVSLMRFKKCSMWPTLIISCIVRFLCFGGILEIDKNCSEQTNNSISQSKNECQDLENCLCFTLQNQEGAKVQIVGIEKCLFSFVFLFFLRKCIFALLPVAKGKCCPFLFRKLGLHPLVLLTALARKRNKTHTWTSEGKMMWIVCALRRWCVGLAIHLHNRRSLVLSTGTGLWLKINVCASFRA